MRLRTHFAFLMIFTLLLILPFPISAHPGRTDSSGGHINHDTGEYHYHHGYSAHQHKDIDGDGTIDCPYNFVDRTNHSSGNSATSAISKQTEGDYMTFTQFILYSLFWCAIITLLLYLLIRTKQQAHEEILESQNKVRELQSNNTRLINDNYNKDSLNALLLKQQSQLNTQIKLLQAELNKVNLKCIGSNKQLPPGVFLLSDSTPAQGDVSPERPYGDFTVYVATKGKKYHRKYNCCGATSVFHIMETPGIYSKCDRCALKDDFSTPPVWYRDIQKGSRSNPVFLDDSE